MKYTLTMPYQACTDLIEGMAEMVKLFNRLSKDAPQASQRAILIAAEHKCYQSMRPFFVALAEVGVGPPSSAQALEGYLPVRFEMELPALLNLRRATGAAAGSLHLMASLHAQEQNVVAALDLQAKADAITDLLGGFHTAYQAAEVPEPRPIAEFESQLTTDAEQNVLEHMLKGDPRCPLALGTEVKRSRYQATNEELHQAGHPGIVRGSCWMSDQAFYLVGFAGDHPRLTFLQGRKIELLTPTS